MGRLHRVEFDYYLTPDGIMYPFHDGRSRFTMSQPVGLGMAPIRPRFERAPGQDGETLIGYNLAPRSVQMIHRRVGMNRTEYWENRADFINHLRPNRQTSEGGLELGSLVKVLPTGEKRYLDVMLDETPQFRSDDVGRWDEFSWNEPIRFLAPDPTFYDPAQVEIVFEGAEPNDQLVFPITYPIYFSMVGYLDKTASVHYEGTFKTFPQIVIAGSILNPRIENVTTGEIIQLEYEIASDQTVTIDLSQNDKTVIDNFDNDLIGTLTTDSDLATFHIAQSPEAPNGVNEFRVSGFNATPETAVLLRYYTRYIGI